MMSCDITCIIYYAPLTHNTHETRCKITKLGDISLHVSAVTGHLEAN